MAKILVVDDDRAILATVDLLLKKAGHQVTTASDGRAGIRLCQNERFDLLIVDIFMPDMDGLETISQVHQVHPDLPVIVISGYQFGGTGEKRPDFLHMATALGAVHGLPKPFRPAELIAAVNTCLDRRKGGAASDGDCKTPPLT
jgi:CheY-like chemotaxis protein